MQIDEAFVKGAASESSIRDTSSAIGFEQWIRSKAGVSSNAYCSLFVDTTLRHCVMQCTMSPANLKSNARHEALDVVFTGLWRSAGVHRMRRGLTCRQHLVDALAIQVDDLKHPSPAVDSRANFG